MQCPRHKNSNFHLRWLSARSLLPTDRHSQPDRFLVCATRGDPKNAHRSLLYTHTHTNIHLFRISIALSQLSRSAPLLLNQLGGQKASPCPPIRLQPEIAMTSLQAGVFRLKDFSKKVANLRSQQAQKQIQSDLRGPRQSPFLAHQRRRIKLQSSPG